MGLWGDIKKMDAEATLFAMELLMPEAWLKRDIEELGGLDIEDSRAIKALARRYQVSEQLMTVRIGQLK